MRFVKIGDTYFNPQRINYIEPLAIGTDPYEPFIRVNIGANSLVFTAQDLGLDLPECTERWEALGVADAMAERAVDIVNEALN